MEQNENLSTGASTDELASPLQPHGDSYFSPQAVQDDPLFCEKVTVPPDTPHDLTDFEPVPLRYRCDGLTPEKQREYVEALADCGVARHAAARIGVSEQAVARVRRRADAHAFDLACEAAQRIGARQLRSIAWERAIAGTVRRHYYHGELKSEEIVYDNRLLVYLLGKTAHLDEPPAATQAVVDNWEPWMEAIEQGLPEPPAPIPAEPEPNEAEGAEAVPDEQAPLCDHICLWDQDGTRWTDFPPPAGFGGLEIGTFGDPDYRRTLGGREEEVVDGWDACEHERRVAAETPARDRFFGFAGGNLDESGEQGGTLGQAELSSPWEAETYETSGRDEPRPAEPPESREARRTLARDEELPPDRPRCEPRIRTL
jgi:hypothetical protein